MLRFENKEGSNVAFWKKNSEKSPSTNYGHSGRGGRVMKLKNCVFELFFQ